MNDDTNEDAPLTPPKPHRAADLSRATARAVAGAIPVVGSAAAELADGLLPNPTADRRERWEHDVTDGVNTLHGRVGEIDRRTGPRTVSLRNGAGAVATYMAKNCPDGLAQQWVTIEELEAAYPEIPRQDLIDGLGDLELHGLVETIAFIGSPSRYQLTDAAYKALDPAIMGWNPEDDAKHLARIVLAKSDTISARELDEETGWPRRRFNPALRLVVGFIGEGRVSRVLQPDYITAHFAPNNAERAQLRQFVA